MRTFIDSYGDAVIDPVDCRRRGLSTAPSSWSTASRPMMGV